MSYEDTEELRRNPPVLILTLPLSSFSIDHGVRTKMSEEGWRRSDSRLWLLFRSCSGLTKISGNLDTSVIITLPWSFRENLTRKYFHEKNSTDSFPPPIKCQSESWTASIECLFIFIFVSVGKCGLCPECQLTGFTNVSRWQSYQHPPIRGQNSW